MASKISPLAGKPAPAEILVDIPKLITAYYQERPDPKLPGQKVIFGTSGHRGSSLEKTFNEWHILAISQAICLFRLKQKITGPLFLGIDTHALSGPAFSTALEVLAANQVNVRIAEKDEYTPTPVISHAILKYNRGRTSDLADGIVITPSHNPPNQGGFKYNPPNGGPADLEITQWIETTANAFLEAAMKGIHKIPLERALEASTTQTHDFLNEYVDDLGNVIDMDLIRNANLHLGVDPLGGAGVHYWGPIAERYGLNLTVVNQEIDPRFSFMTVDWDGKIRMDPSSPPAMQRLIGLKTKFDVAFACDTDHDRHGIISKNFGLLPPNHYLTAAIYYLFQHRENWKKSAAVGKTIVSSQMIDRVTEQLGRKIYEVPVGFKWFVNGLLEGKLGFAGEESAGASLLRRDGSPWTTDKDGIALALLSAEITAALGRDPGEVYQMLSQELGECVFERQDVTATPAQKDLLSRLSAEDIHTKELAGEKITSILSRAPGNHEPIGGIKVITPNGWFAARPSGTENIYRIYAESFLGAAHLKRVLNEAETIIDTTLQDNHKP